MPFFDLVQRGYPVEDLSRIFRLRMAVETASPLLFRAYSPRLVLVACGLGIAAVGAVGLAAHGETRRSPAGRSDSMPP